MGARTKVLRWWAGICALININIFTLLAHDLSLKEIKGL